MPQAPASSPSPAPAPAPAALVPGPRIIITYCTQCHWLLRAAYYAQELLSTFSTDLGEVSLRPGRGGVFWVDIFVNPAGEGDGEGEGEGDGGEQGGIGEGAIGQIGEGVRIWDRKVEGGFPETKILKRKVRDLIDPGRGLGHVDRDHVPLAGAAASGGAGVSEGGSGGGQAHWETGGQRLQGQESKTKTETVDGVARRGADGVVNDDKAGDASTIAEKRTVVCEDCA